MISKNMNIQAFSEVKCILDYLPIEYTEKIPKKLLELIESLYDEKYKIEINLETKLKNQNFLEDTKNIIAVLKYNYWCKNDEEKEILAKNFEKNEKIYQECLKRKYNVNNMFKNRKGEESSNNVSLSTIKKDSLLAKVLKRIRDFFRKE